MGVESAGRTGHQCHGDGCKYAGFWPRGLRCHRHVHCSTWNPPARPPVCPPGESPDSGWQASAPRGRWATRPPAPGGRRGLCGSRPAAAGLHPRRASHAITAARPLWPTQSDLSLTITATLPGTNAGQSTPATAASLHHFGYLPRIYPLSANTEFGCLLLRIVASHNTITIRASTCGAGSLWLHI